MHDVFLVQSKHLSDNLIIQKTQFPSIQKFVIKNCCKLNHQKVHSLWCLEEQFEMHIS